MLKTLMITAAASSLLISGTLAQSTNGGASNSPKFVAMQNPDQWVFSKFKGTDVVGPNDETIGGVNDMLFDKSGRILGVIVGVGGFLGIGQKNVAIDMSAFQVVAAPNVPSTSSVTDPTNVKLKVAWTKDELQQAPDFQYYKASGSASNDSRPVPGTTGQRNRMVPSPAGQ
jgi:hypothetical protein